MKPSEFWGPWEERAENFDEVIRFIETVRDRWLAGKNMSFAWRGVVDADWPLHSSLHRRLLWTTAGALSPDERQLALEEEKIAREVHRWGLHYSAGRRLPFMLQLAMLQHYGSPTRLLDVSFNAWIGVWFAVEQKWVNGSEMHQDADGRVFAIEVSKTIINDQTERGRWEDSMGRPWPVLPAKNADANADERDWTTRVFAWRPPHIDARIAAQNGGFVFGGIPHDVTASGRKFWPKGKSSSAGHWKLDEVRRSTSIAARPHRLERTTGARPKQPLFTLRIAAKAKPEIRSRLAALYGYEHRTVYPDYSGFSDFGTPHLKKSP